MPSCCVASCGQYTGNKTPGVSFHRFPRGEELKRQWVEAIDKERPNWQPSHASVVCSLHFREKDIDRVGAFPKLLTEAIPCLLLETKTPDIKKKIPVIKKKIPDIVKKPPDKISDPLSIEHNSTSTLLQPENKLSRLVVRDLPQEEKNLNRPVIRRVFLCSTPKPPLVTPTPPVPETPTPTLRQPPLEEKNASECEHCESLEDMLSKKTIIETQLRRKLETSKFKAIELRRRIHTLMKHKRRQAKRIEKLKTIVKFSKLDKDFLMTLQDRIEPIIRLSMAGEEVEL